MFPDKAKFVHVEELTFESCELTYQTISVYVFFVSSL